MRLPGTINLPNAKKRAAGRKATLAKVIAAATDWSRMYSIDQFAEADLQVAVPPAGNIAPVGLDELPTSVLPATRALLQLGDAPQRPIGGDQPSRYPSRSEAVFRSSCDLARAGCPAETIAGVLINPELGISASILEKANPVRYALRQAKAGLAANADGWPDADKNGNPRATLRNAIVAAQRLGLHFEFDEFRRRKLAGGHALEQYQGELNDDACLLIRREMLEQFGFGPRPEHVRDAVNMLCLENTFHPIRQMLDALKWDGVPRLDNWLTTYLGAEDTDLNRAISRIVPIAAVRRVRRPGVKFDEILVLEGPQGSGKSTALMVLAGEENHSDQDILALDSKGQMEMLEGVWIYELGELDGITRAEVGKVKAFASRQVDRSRLAYGRFRESRPRQAILVGTTNDAKYLRDLTGNRRFWPVRTGTIDLKALRRDRDQLWAEAAAREAAGESISLPEELWEAAREQQDARLEGDPWLEILAEVNGEAHGDVARVPTRHLLDEVLDIPRERQSQYQTKRLAAAMHKLGWGEPRNVRVRGKVVKGYERPKRPDHTDDLYAKIT
jgi:predicted P-loop ATPase